MPQVQWFEALHKSPIYLVETQKRNGNVRLSELGVLAQAAAASTPFDWSQHFGKAGLVFVDGSHAKDYTRKDSDTAFRLVSEGGVVVWHDYGVWEGVTLALEELDAERKLGLRHVRGTSLVIWRASGKG